MTREFVRTENKWCFTLVQIYEQWVKMQFYEHVLQCPKSYHTRILTLNKSVNEGKKYRHRIQGYNKEQKGIE